MSEKTREDIVAVALGVAFALLVLLALVQVCRHVRCHP
jgi:hypothetical protein